MFKILSAKFQLIIFCLSLFIHSSIFSMDWIEKSAIILAQGTSKDGLLGQELLDEIKFALNQLFSSDQLKDTLKNHEPKQSYFVDRFVLTFRSFDEAARAKLNELNSKYGGQEFRSSTLSIVSASSFSIKLDILIKFNKPVDIEKLLEIYVKELKDVSSRLLSPDNDDCPIITLKICDESFIFETKTVSLCYDRNFKCVTAAVRK